MRMNKKLLTLTMLAAATTAATAQNTPTSQMESIDRGVVALKGKTGGNFVSWRLLGTEDDEATTFDIIYNGNTIKTGLTVTCFEHTTGNASGQYQVVTKHNGVAVDTTEAVKPWADVYTTLKLSRPATGANGGNYSPNDCSVGDVDGDGKYELIVKWDPDNSKDNSQNGITDNVYLDCYRLTGEQLWRIDLGRNIRAGAHYTQFMVYDFDGDGRAELMCKTAPGSIDGQGNYVNQAATDATIRSASNTTLYRNSNGRITGGQEYLTVFNGLTGAAIHTIFYNPNRDMGYGGAASGSKNWGDVDGKNDAASYGNRGERYLAAVAYLDGADKRPSGVFSRGYYGYAFIWAVDFDGEQLHQKWLHSSKSKTQYTVTTYDADGKGTDKTYTPGRCWSGEGRNTMFANGNHNLSVADVDGDGCDEIIWGSAACDNDGRLLYSVGFGHGDAIHLADLDPTRPGLELFDIHEDKGTYSWDVHDAATGEILHKGGNSGVDNGRGIAAQLAADHYGYYFSSSDERSQRSAVSGNIISSSSTSLNFRIYWDGDLQDELLDGSKIDKWNGNGTSRLYINGKDPYSYNHSSTCNSTKNTPNLQADILGDWREEIILWSSEDNCTLNIFSTNEPTNYMVPTLMHDHVYRMGIAWQNVAYNQPPHLGYYLPDYFNPSMLMLDGTTPEQDVCLGDSIKPIVFKWRKCKSTPIVTSTAPDGTQKRLNLALPGFTNDRNTAERIYTLTGLPDQMGDYTFAVKLTGQNGNVVEELFTVHVGEPSGITTFSAEQKMSSPRGDDACYNLQGQRIGQPRSGIYLRNGKKYIK